MIKLHTIPSIYTQSSRTYIQSTGSTICGSIRPLPPTSVVIRVAFRQFYVHAGTVGSDTIPGYKP